MKKVYYYLGKDGKIYLGRDIAIAAKLVHNITLTSENDLDEYITFRCAGVEKKLENVTVKDLVELGEITKATVLYKETLGCSLKDAADYVEALVECNKEKK